MTEKYFELIEAGVSEVARACGCEVGQWVARVYPRAATEGQWVATPEGQVYVRESHNPPVEQIGTEAECRAFIKKEMKD